MTALSEILGSHTQVNHNFCVLRSPGRSAAGEPPRPAALQRTGAGGAREARRARARRVTLVVPSVHLRTGPGSFSLAPVARTEMSFRERKPLSPQFSEK